MTSGRPEPESRPAADGDEWLGRAFDGFYLDLYRHRGDAEAHSLVAALSRLGLRGPYCEVACGPGRFLRALADAGEVAWGLDLSAPLLARAREILGGGRLVRGDMRSLPFRPASFGSVLLLFTSFGYFRDPADDVRVLAEAGRVLRDGGHFVLDFLDRGTTLRGLVPESRREVAGMSLVERRWVDPDGPFLRKRVELESGAPSHPGLPREERVRLYGPGELRDLVGAQGLVIDVEWGDYEGNPFHAGRTPRHILVTHKEVGR